MAGVTVAAAAAWLDAELRTGEIQDYPNAHNGLQLASDRRLTRIAAAVDGCQAVIAEAVESGADLLIVHHGILWGGAQRIDGAFYRKLRLAIGSGLAIYSAHLPLDLHPRYGNNALLAEAVGLKKTVPFLDIGVLGTFRGLPLAELLDRAEAAVSGPVHLAPGGPDVVRALGVVSGGGGDLVAKAAAAGADTLLTGEGQHWTFTAAEELGINVLYAGHYATETFGVKALAAAASEKFGVPWHFIDHPTGL